MGRPSLFIVASLLTALMAGVSCTFKLPDIPGLPLIPELPPVETVIHPVPGYGVLNGTVESSVYNNRTFWGFRSVFYAEMPTPEMRFLPPLPRKPYPEDEIVQAIYNNAGCVQHLPYGKEDCLSVSIYTPYLTDDSSIPNTLLPVIVWIHGGSFRSGQAIEYLPGRFMEEDVVLVVIQYRLGPLGFLSFDTDEVPGNAGIFDQIESLRWVNKYIKYFGGNKDWVTIAGESAGSASVSILLLAEQAKGLFHRAIGESGSVLAEWAVDRDGRGKKASMRVAEIAGCPLDPYEDLLDCVRTIDAQALIDAYGQFREEDLKNGGMGFGASNPVMQIAGAQRILEVEPRKQFETGNYNNVPIMFGANKHEGVLVFSYAWKDYLEPNNMTSNATFLENDLVPNILKALHVRDDTGVLADALVDKYLADADMGDFTSMTPGLTDMLGVLFLKSAGYETVRLHSLHNEHSYWYSFNYEGRNSLFIYLFASNPPNYPPVDHGVDHADEMIYLFIYPFPSDPPFLDEREKDLSLKMIQVWTNFAYYGNPTPDDVELLPGLPKFLPYSRDRESYMDIDCEWESKIDYTKTYTISVDDIKAGHIPCRCAGLDADVCFR
ncbi:Carboxylic ester hydrolase [Daphnia magna]|uniref:Carboxylic ester hydrolase n=1 Tax=Daphnia magna TaxID=35525 RepID=A0A0P5XR58_9CRUS|nr:Carboxylic ester hydrolase [Daphnia magna]